MDAAAKARIRLAIKRSAGMSHSMSIQRQLGPLDNKFRPNHKSKHLISWSPCASKWQGIPVDVFQSALFMQCPVEGLCYGRLPFSYWLLYQCMNIWAQMGHSSTSAKPISLC
jgi:hypothetical protein